MAVTDKKGFEIVEGIVAFSLLPEEDKVALVEAAKLRKVPRNDALFQQGQEAEGLFVVRSGEIKVTRVAGDGREQIFYIARPGRPIVEGVRFDAGAYPASAVALRPTTAWLVANPVLQKLGTQRPAIFTALVDLRAKRADRNMVLITDLSLRTVPARLASFICTLMAVESSHGGDPTAFARELTTETVAGRLGTVREEVSRALALLEREGALRVSPQRIEIIDSDRLKSIAYGNDKRPRAES